MRQALTIYAFLVKCYYEDDQTYELAKDVLADQRLSFKKLHTKFYNAYNFGFARRPKEKCTINVHTFWHLHQLRERIGPLWKTSAEPFEAMYAVLRRLYVPGTKNTTKQMMENFYMRQT